MYKIASVQEENEAWNNFETNSIKFSSILNEQMKLAINYFFPDVEVSMISKVFFLKSLIIITQVRNDP